MKNSQDTVKFCFQTPAWDRCVQKVFELQQVHRQTDRRFIDILNNIRIGNVPEDIVEKLMATSKQKIEKDGILATRLVYPTYFLVVINLYLFITTSNVFVRLCSHTQDAFIINESKLKNLPGEQKIFQAEDSEGSSSKDLDQQTPVPGRLILKVGAQVMLLKNISVSSGLVNGARGVVKEFKDGLPVVRFRNNKEYVAKHERLVHNFVFFL